MLLDECSQGNLRRAKAPQDDNIQGDARWHSPRWSPSGVIVT